MRHNISGRKLNRTTSHRLAMLSNMAQALLKHEQIKTTLPKAKELRRYVEKLITIAKKNTLSSRRKLFSKLNDSFIVQKSCSTLSERYKNRHGGYTRIVKAGYRYGDNAPMAVIELIDRDVFAKGKDLSTESSNNSSEDKSNKESDVNKIAT